ncbi:hypothetical protein L596_023763 [Steinernema carpocapsae]|uniref:Uncharacterized protein n=1 Tax=Steinernema carpocapsae TaxID=34508 RepID=A0A4U5MFE0_STECR|nr:hypothetical protein L596_023763 [Steinernema carpocapsae]
MRSRLCSTKYGHPNRAGAHRRAHQVCRGGSHPRPHFDGRPGDVRDHEAGEEASTPRTRAHRERKLHDEVRLRRSGIRDVQQVLRRIPRSPLLRR